MRSNAGIMRTMERLENQMIHAVTNHHLADYWEDGKFPRIVRKAATPVRPPIKTEATKTREA